MKQTVYIAGPMRGKPDYNRAARQTGNGLE